ncbi:hypothetical protein [Enterococcus sp. RIT-PI-f]|uniref:hypothetical protein n=1 Tax=Enterococcus sp. RIT-PI-f TaxID=1690244 RepID=UPI0035686EBF
MNLFDEAQNIYNTFKGRVFSFEMLDLYRMLNEESPYTKKERLMLVSCLQRKYGLVRTYRMVDGETVTLFSFEEMK